MEMRKSQMNCKKVSIIIPVYNTENYVKRCVASIIDQTYGNIQLLIINDGSTDKSEDIILKLIAGYDWIKYVKQENQGVSAARNRGIALSEGEYLLFVDGDDYVEHTYVEQLVGYAEKFNSELVITGYTMEDENGRKIRSVNPGYYKQDKDEAWAYRICAVCSRLYNKEYWDRNDLKFIQEDGARGEDVPLALYTNLTAKNITMMNGNGYYYIQRSNSAMHQFRGLQNFHFPYQTMTEYALKCNSSKNKNSIAYYQFGILKFFAQFAFDLSRGASKEQKKLLWNYIVSFLHNYCPNYKENWKKLNKKNVFFMHSFLISFLLWREGKMEKHSLGENG